MYSQKPDLPYNTDKDNLLTSDISYQVVGHWRSVFITSTTHLVLHFSFYTGLEVEVIMYVGMIIINKSCN